MANTTYDNPSLREPRTSATAGDIPRFEIVPARSVHAAALSTSIPLRQAIRREQLRLMVPLADTTIYEMELRGEFPRRFQLTSRCVAWDRGDIEAWIDARQKASERDQVKRAPPPDVRQRKHRPVKSVAAA